ncbi:hypothetical protein ACIP4U_39415 [Streptomyces caelestis]|uniref:hypothetical protein n=1 Tax=Streptomyces caelestis TaxID=36816 RepID=UPI00380A11C9
MSTSPTAPTPPTSRCSRKSARALTTFRSLAISLAHLAGRTNKAAAHDHYPNHPADALCELGLTG